MPLTTMLLLERYIEGLLSVSMNVHRLCILMVVGSGSRQKVRVGHAEPRRVLIVYLLWPLGSLEPLAHTISVQTTVEALRNEVANHSGPNPRLVVPAEAHPMLCKRYMTAHSTGTALSSRQGL